jgi:hypothetical protein
MEVQQWQVNCTNSVSSLYDCSGDQRKGDEIGGACGTYGGAKQIHTGFWWRDVKERNNLECLRIDGMVLINRTGVDWD